MTPTQQWIFELALVYAVPSFLAGIGTTLLFVHRRDVLHAIAALPRLLSISCPADEGRNALPDRFILEK